MSDNFLDRQIDFIGLGPQKCGTTWLATQLRKHPDIYMTDEKQIFSLEAALTQRKDYYYEWPFKNYNGEKWIGTYHNSYFDAPYAVEYIRQHFPKTKLYVILREPVDRAVSSYLHLMRHGFIGKRVSFEEAIKRYDVKYYCLDKSFYDVHLERWFDYFETSQIKVLIYEDMKSDPIGYLQGLYDFLDIESFFDDTLVGQKIGGRAIPRSFLISKLMQIILKRYYEVRHRQLKNFDLSPAIKLGKKIREMVDAMNYAPVTNVNITPRTIDILRETYLSTKEYVEKLLERDLDEVWNKRSF